MDVERTTYIFYYLGNEKCYLNWIGVVTLRQLLEEHLREPHSYRRVSTLIRGTIAAWREVELSWMVLSWHLTYLPKAISFRSPSSFTGPVSWAPDAGEIEARVASGWLACGLPLERLEPTKKAFKLASTFFLRLCCSGRGSIDIGPGDESKSEWSNEVESYVLIFN